MAARVSSERRIEIGRLEVRELEIPAAVGAPGWDDFASAIDLHYANEVASYGSTDLYISPAEALTDYLDQENEPTRLFAAWDGPRMIGTGRYEIEAGEHPTTAWLMADVAPDARGVGVGRALATHLEALARGAGIRKLLAYAVSATADGPQVTSPTGFGSVAVGNPEVRFLTAAGYTLQQVARGSRLALPVALDELSRETSAAAGPDYSVRLWGDRTPEPWRAQMAELRQLMSLEEPTAGLEEPVDLWSVERLVADEERRADGIRSRITAAVEHVPSGRLAGFTTLSVPRELERPVWQDDTLVRPEHRGYRLGMLLKIANLTQLQREHPGHPSVMTFNAEENRPMLDVNERIGFLAVGHDGAWRKDLAD